MKKVIVFLGLIGLIFVLSCSQSSKESVEQKDTTPKTAVQETEKAPKADHTCAWCGMDASKYPKWEYYIDAEGQDRMFFDGAKCMFRILLIEDKRPETVTDIQVKDYYTLEYVDAKTAVYVTGSDVLGPMGNELVPFASQEAAEEFKRDHSGTMILHFEDVTMETIKSLSGNTEMK